MYTLFATHQENVSNKLFIVVHVPCRQWHYYATAFILNGPTRLSYLLDLNFTLNWATNLSSFFGCLLHTKLDHKALLFFGPELCTQLEH
jgi:hypothetical protein